MLGRSFRRRGTAADGNIRIPGRVDHHFGKDPLGSV